MPRYGGAGRAGRLTVQQLADAAGVSRRMLTLIEQGQANPSLVTVDKVARALGTDFASLARDTQPDPVAVNEPGSAAGVWSSAAGSHAALQVATRRQPSAELWEWVLQPGDRYGAQPDAAGSEELFLVLDGALTLEVEGLEPVTVKDRRLGSAGQRPQLCVRQSWPRASPLRPRGPSRLTHAAFRGWCAASADLWWQSDGEARRGQ